MICPICNDVIGVYEPIAVLSQQQIRHTSLAVEPALRESNELVLHQTCAAVRPDARPDRIGSQLE